MKRKFKLLTASLGLVLGFTALTGCCDTAPITEDDKVVFSKIELNKKTLKLNVGDTETLVATVKANKETYEEKVTWESTDENVATVDATGKIIAAKAGSTTITAKIGNVYAICTVTVESVGEDPLVFSKIELNKSTLTLEIEEEQTLTATVKANKETYDDKVAWESSNTTVATVDANGKITAKAVGSTTITAKIGGVFAICTVTVKNKQTYEFSGLSKKRSFTVSEKNKGNQTNKEEEFVEKDKPYIVGTENNFSVLPILNLFDLDTFDTIDNANGSIAKWNKDFKYEVKRVISTNNLETVGDDIYTIADNRNGLIKFSEAAIGNRYQIKVTAGGLTEAELAYDYSSVTYTVDVVKGYNVYNSKELGYIDQRHGSGPDVQVWKAGDVAGFCPNWDAFKIANGLRADYNPSCLIIQDNLTVTKDDIPSSFFYTAAELSGANDDAAVGSMKDTCELYLYCGLNEDSADQYAYSMENTLKVYGNYFTIDFSAFPLVKRGWGEKTEVGKVVSHATAFRCHYGSLDFSDLKVRGNSKRANDESEKIFGGGLIMFKCTAYSKTVTTSNVISRQCFITYMGEDPAEGNPYQLTFNVKGCKAYDSYNCHIYNYCGIVNAENSDFGMCGGPCIIADHGGFSDAEGPEALNTDATSFDYQVHGQAPVSTFKDCTFNNYVAGTEAWFVQMNATFLVPQIKGLSDLYAPYGMAYAVNEKHQPVVVSQTEGVSMFNFIALNKVSGESLDAVQQPACGSMTFINTAKNTTNVYNYAAPNVDNVNSAKEVRDALIAAQTAQGADQITAIQQLISLAAKYEVSWSDTVAYSDLFTNLTTFASNIATAELTNHALLRGANNAGAPIFQNGDAYTSYNQYTSDPDQIHFLQDINNVATWTTGSPNIDPIDNTHPFVTNHPDTTALYYSGMMLVFGLNYLA